MTLDEVACTVVEAAAWFKVSPKTVRSWVHRYQISALSGVGKNARRYRFADLVQADRRARGLVEPP